MELASELPTISIRYDGLDADQHAIEIGALGESLQGLGRIIGVVATFAATEKLVVRTDARPLKVVVGPPEANCVTLQAALNWLDQSQFVAGTASAVIGGLIVYVVTRFAGQKEEMKHLRAIAEQAIQQAGHRDSAVIDRLISTIEKMAEQLRPAVRKAVKPVGTTARTLTVGPSHGDGPKVVVDKAMRDAIDAEEPLEIGPEQMSEVQFIEMNLDARTSRIVLVDGDDDEARYTAEITDPEFQVPNNAYAEAFASQSSLQVRMKPTLREGEVERWYISAHG